MTGTDFDEDYTNYQRNRSGLRKIVRKVYLDSAASLLEGATLDFGCGIGELLSRLPPGSKGLEYNQATVEYCVRNGLDVDFYDGYSDDWQLSTVQGGSRFRSMVVSHVLEHLQLPADVLNKLLSAAARLGISRMLVIVPGRAGYRIDDTHRTFIDRELLADPNVVAGTGFRLSRTRYFPGNLRLLGDLVPHHELQVLYTIGQTIG